MPSTVPASRGAEHDDLAPAAGGVGVVGCGLAVHAEVAVALLDHAVGLGGHQVQVGREAHVEGLAAPAEGEQQLVGAGRDGGADGHRAVEAGDGAAEGVGRVVGTGRGPGHEGGDDLGVGGDLGGVGQPGLGLEVGEVVDVAVECGGDVGPAGGGLVLVAVDGVGVGLGDDADAGPAGVAQHQHLGLGGDEGPVQQLVAGDAGSEGGGVVAQLADLGRGLVDEREAAVGHPHRAGAEGRVGAPLGQHRGHGRAVEVEPVSPHQQREPGRVAAPHLEAVEGGEGGLDRGHGLDGGGTGPGAGQPGDRPGGAEAVATDGPGAVAHPDEGGVDRLHLRRGSVEEELLEVGVQLGQGVVDGAEVGAEPGDQGGVGQQGADAGGAAQLPVGVGQEGAGRGQGVVEVGGRGRCGHQAGGLLDQPQEGLGGRGRAVTRSAGDGDDAAHGGSPGGGRRRAPILPGAPLRPPATPAGAPLPPTPAPPGLTTSRLGRTGQGSRCPRTARADHFGGGGVRRG